MCAKEGGASPVEGTPLHVHEREEEAWFVLEEEKVGHRKFTAPAGSFVIAPRGIPPAHKSADRIPRGSSPSCRLLVFEAFFREQMKLRAASAASEPFPPSRCVMA